MKGTHVCLLSVLCLSVHVRQEGVHVFFASVWDYTCTCTYEWHVQQGMYTSVYLSWFVRRTPLSHSLVMLLSQSKTIFQTT